MEQLAPFIDAITQATQQTSQAIAEVAQGQQQIMAAVGESAQRIEAAVSARPRSSVTRIRKDTDGSYVSERTDD
jgi:antitoxin (DNA-binding transcriptional repressor) of toxin-antitoxin stability system